MRWVISLTFAPKTLRQKRTNDTGKASTNLLPNPNRPPPKRDRLRAAKFWQFLFISSSSGILLIFFFLFSVKRKLSAVYIAHR